MKCGWCETFNGTELRRGTPFNVVVIADQLSRCNSMLSEMVSEGKMLDAMFNATAKARAPRGNEKVNNDGKATEEKKEDN